MIDFIWLLDISENPPSSPNFNCSWDDGNADVSIPFDLDTNQEVTDAEYKYHIYHKYTQAGEYNVSCTLFNKVSSKSITKLVKPFLVTTNLYKMFIQYFNL